MRRHIRHVVVILLVVASSTSHAAAIRSISVKGNSVFTAREIAGWLTLRPGVPYAEAPAQADCRTVLDNYRAQGYLAARARFATPTFSADSALVDLSLVMEEGKQTLIGRIAVAGSVRLSEAEVLDRFDVTPGGPLDEALLERDIDALLVGYEKLGYPFARCSVEDLARASGPVADSVDIVLRVDEGARMTIDEIRVEGNKDTDAGVIIRETRIEPGETFNPAKVDAIRSRLNRLNIFSSVSEPELYLRHDRGGLLIKIQEGNTNTFDGILGYIPASAPGVSGYLTGLASVSMRNLFGTGRKLSMQWQRDDRYSQQIGLRYLEPWILGAPINLDGGFFQRQQDSTYVRRTFDLKAELMFSEELSLGLVFSSEQVIPSTDSLTAAQVPAVHEITGGVEVQYDTRDDIYSPASGARYQTEYQYGHKAVSGIPPAAFGLIGTGGTIQRVGVDFEFFLPTFRRQVVAVGLHGREVRTGQVEESEMYRFGGASTLRGYRENQFLGAEVAWTNLEYRFLLARRSFFFGFVDTGYYKHPGNDILGISASQAFKYGYGIGVRFDTVLGNLGVSFALGQGDTFSTAKIHFGLINEF